MQVLIINDRPWHYECYIHIIDFCIKYNIKVDILESYLDSLGFREFYLNRFKDKITFTKGVNILKDKYLANPFTNTKYDKVFVITDNFIVGPFYNYIQNLNAGNAAINQFIFLNHTSKIELPRFPNHIDIRHFPYKKNKYAYYFMDLISIEEKQEILSQEKKTNILISANPNNINIKKEIQTLNNINAEACIHWVSRDLSSFKESKLNRVSLHESLNQSRFNELLKKSHYVYIPEYHSKNYKTDSTTSILNSAYSYLCQIIWPERNYNKNYKLYSPLEYSDGLEIEPNPDIQLVAKERQEQIDHRNKVFFSFLPKANRQEFKNT